MHRLRPLVLPVVVGATFLLSATAVVPVVTAVVETVVSATAGTATSHAEPVVLL